MSTPSAAASEAKSPRKAPEPEKKPAPATPAPAAAALTTAPAATEAAGAEKKASGGLAARKKKKEMEDASASASSDDDSVSSEKARRPKKERPDAAKKHGTARKEKIKVPSSTGSAGLFLKKAEEKPAKGDSKGSEGGEGGVPALKLSQEKLEDEELEAMRLNPAYAKKTDLKVPFPVYEAYQKIAEFASTYTCPPHFTRPPFIFIPVLIFLLVCPYIGCTRRGRRPRWSLLDPEEAARPLSLRAFSATLVRFPLCVRPLAG
jgi:hypothetical protein